LFDALGGLREEAKWAIACRYFLRLSEEETAAILGCCARGTVKSRLSRALRSLRAEIAKERAAG
jgi:RNA polymerase sigma-70 factor (ECF subfamily)